MQNQETENHTMQFFYTSLNDLMARYGAGRGDIMLEFSGESADMGTEQIRNLFWIYQEMEETGEKMKSKLVNQALSEKIVQIGLDVGIERSDGLWLQIGVESTAPLKAEETAEVKQHLKKELEKGWTDCTALDAIWLYLKKTVPDLVEKQHAIEVYDEKEYLSMAQGKELVSTLLYGELSGELYRKGEDMEDEIEYLDGYGLAGYEEEIAERVFAEQDFENTGRGLAVYIHQQSLAEKIYAIEIGVEILAGKLYSRSCIKSFGSLSAEEIALAEDYLIGQFADGWGEGLEQRAIEVDGGFLYLHFYQEDMQLGCSAQAAFIKQDEIRML